MTKYDIFDVANWFLAKEPMTHKKLQKICYYAVAWGYALLNKEICERSEFQAWVHGPVSIALYERYKNVNFWEKISLDIAECKNYLDNELNSLLQSVWITYGDQTGNSLEALTHIEPPWKNARGKCGVDDKCNTPISVSDMTNYYRSIYTGGDN